MPLNERELKLWRLALDPAAGEGEIANAAIALLRSLRQRKVSAYDDHDVRNTFGGRYRTPPPSPTPPPSAARWYTQSDWPGTIIMPFGKYAGWRLGEMDPDYLRWCVANLDQERRGNLVKAMAWLLEDLENRQRRGFF